MSSPDLRDRPLLAPLAELVAALHAAKPGIRPLLVGAMARDVLLSFAHGIPAGRATQDMDFAFALDSWDDFTDLKNALLASGSFVGVARVAHQLTFAKLYRVDLIPFGGIENPGRSIAWPPHQGFEIQVAGFREAMAHAVEVRLPGDTVVEVASLPAQAVLKLFAWRDRRHERPGVDAGDLRLLLRHYLDAGNHDRLYGEANHLLELESFDRGNASAWLLGHDARKLLRESESIGAATLQSLQALLATEIDLDGPLALVTGMRGGNAQADFDLLTFFAAALEGKRAP